MDTPYEDRFLPNTNWPAATQNLPTRGKQSHSSGQDGRSQHLRSGSGHASSGKDGKDRKGSAASSATKDGSKTAGSRNANGQRICGKCGEVLSGQFVRALENTFHLECFTCHDCGKIVASKFFPVPDVPPDQYPLCETDYFRRLDLLCHQCGGALRGSYITALDRKYHIEHFTCSICPTVFGAQDSYYEHEGNVYCHFHYSTKFAQRCNGCDTAILKQFVEIFRNGQNQHWHPECYMIHKYWNVRLHSSGQSLAGIAVDAAEQNATEEMRLAVKEAEEKVEEKVMWIWRSLSAFEEKSATCISDMLLHVSNGAYVDGVMAAKKFIAHLEVLFGAADNLDVLLTTHTPKGLSYSREAKLLCKKVVAFFQLLAESQTTGVRRLGVTQELLSLVTGLAHYLKLLIRICLQGALKLERETGSIEGLSRFLEQVNVLDDHLAKGVKTETSFDSTAYIFKMADTCPVCDKPVEDRCVRCGPRVFHSACVVCKQCARDLLHNLDDARWCESLSQVLCHQCAPRDVATITGFFTVSRLSQYVHLLKVAHVRLLATIRSSGALPHTSDDPNLKNYNSDQGHRPEGNGGPPMLSPDTRSKSHTGATGPEQQQQQQQPGSTYEQTLGDIRRLRSTRMDKHLSSTMKKARTSTIIDGPKSISVRPGDSGDEKAQPTGTFQIVQDIDPAEAQNTLAFSGTDSITLDDIPRLVAAEQAREQRPNASKFARGAVIPQDPRPKLVNGRRFSLANDLEKTAGDGSPYRGKRYFSELSALEYFVVRHVAVLLLEPLLEGAFNQEELLDLIETKRSPTFWGKFGKAFQKELGRKQLSKKKGVFGVALEQLIERDGADSTDCAGPGALRVPALVQDAVSAMRSMDMSVEGVFRKNGNIKRLNQIADEIDANGGDAVDLNKENPVQVAALLKKFLRSLPDPILTQKLHRLFIASQKIGDDEKRRRVLHLTCCLLPKPNRDTMEVLFTFLNWVSSFSHVDEESGSKMDIHNLATVMAPNILYSNPKAQSTGMDDSFLAIEAVHSLIEYNDVMCQIPDDLQLVLADTSLFDGSAELTTKEILKRYGDRSRFPTTHQAYPAESSSAGISSPSAAVTRIDTDPHQAQAMRKENSVRPVHGPAGYGAPRGMESPTTKPLGDGDEYRAASPQFTYANDRAGRASNESLHGGNATGANATATNGAPAAVHRMSAIISPTGPTVGVGDAG